MKKLHLLPVFFASLALVSCNDNDDNKTEYPDYVAFATTHIVDKVDAVDDDTDDDDKEEVNYGYTLDNGTKFILDDNEIENLYTPKADERVIIYYDIEDKMDSDKTGYDASINLFGINYVLVGESLVVNTPEEDEKVVNHAMSYIYKDITMSGNYINLCGAFRADDEKKVKIYVVENNNSDEEEAEGDYLYLEMRYDRNGDEPIGHTYERYISLDVEAFADKIEAAKGVMLKITTLKSGSITVKVDKNGATSTAAARTTSTL